jgi:hypothetical protein
MGDISTIQNGRVCISLRVIYPQILLKYCAYDLIFYSEPSDPLLTSMMQSYLQTETASDSKSTPEILSSPHELDSSSSASPVSNSETDESPNNVSKTTTSILYWRFYRFVVMPSVDGRHYNKTIEPPIQSILTVNSNDLLQYYCHLVTGIDSNSNKS